LLVIKDVAYATIFFFQLEGWSSKVHELLIESHEKEEEEEHDIAMAATNSWEFRW